MKHRVSKEAGFSVVETLVALGIMGIICSTLAVALVNQARANAHTQQVSAAVVAAQRVLDHMRSVALYSVDSDNNHAEEYLNIDVSGLSFDVYATFCTNPSLCSGNAMKQVELDVQLNGETKYVVETVFSSFD